jgi:hypothetical protein
MITAFFVFVTVASFAAIAAGANATARNPRRR